MPRGERLGDWFHAEVAADLELRLSERRPTLVLAAFTRRRYLAGSWAAWSPWTVKVLDQRAV
jgi:hypothetical protein